MTILSRPQCVNSLRNDDASVNCAHHWITWWLASSWSTPGRYLNRCWLIVSQLDTLEQTWVLFQDDDKITIDKNTLKMSYMKYRPISSACLEVAVLIWICFPNRLWFIMIASRLWRLPWNIHFFGSNPKWVKYQQSSMHCHKVDKCRQRKVQLWSRTQGNEQAAPRALASRQSLKKYPNLPHDDVIKWKHFPRYWLFVRGIQRWPVNSPHEGQWRGALMFSLICAWTNGWVNKLQAGDLRRHHAHHDVIVMAHGQLPRREQEHAP